jgi:CubicO group peptidase (beta-lactamase class C family)
MPTTEVGAAQKDRYQFKEKLDKGIDSVTFLPWNSDQAMTWEASLSINYTDGILILHKGNIVYEKYFGELTPDGLHAAMSVSKTFTGTLGALLVHEGLLNETKTGAEYIPEITEFGFRRCHHPGNSGYDHRLKVQ